MSYLDTVKEQVDAAKEDLIERYKTFVEDYIVKDLAASMINVSVIEKGLIEDEELNVEDFSKWLKHEGFIISVTEPSKTLSISLPH